MVLRPLASYKHVIREMGCISFRTTRELKQNLAENQTPNNYCRLYATESQCSAGGKAYILQYNIYLKLSVLNITKTLEK